MENPWKKHREMKLSSGSAVYSIVSHSLVALLSFHFGMMYGSGLLQESGNLACDAFSCLQHCLEVIAPNASECICPECLVPPPVVTVPPTTKHGGGGADQIFPTAAIGQVVAGAALVDRANFIKSFDIGVPWDRPWPGNRHALLLYTHNSSLPSAETEAASSSSSLPVFSSAAEATKNCHTLKVVLAAPNAKHQCLAIVGQWESYQVHKFTRLPKGNDKAEVSANHTLRYVARAINAYERLPKEDTLTKSNYGRILTDYIAKVPETLKRLKPLAVKAAGNDNTVVVMYCNFGQSELFLNFVCSARARNLDLSKILLFATDNETVALAQNLGVHVFDVQDAFGEMPQAAAGSYRDQVYAGIMLGKTYCVHLVNMLGYDVLFQDADIIWYKNFIDGFFKDVLQSGGDFDMYFQDDGDRTAYYAPYAANSGFYYIRHNARTEYLFSMFARIGDQVISGGSHQTVLASLINEHVSWRGLKVKVFAVDDPVVGEKFPGGYHYQVSKYFMKDLIAGKKDPFIFHMHWTKNKDEKRKFFQQMSAWFVKDECINKKVSAIDNWSPEKPNSLTARCCHVEPQFQCHFQDKPSTKPCKGSPFYDVTRNASFW